MRLIHGLFMPGLRLVQSRCSAGSKEMQAGSRPVQSRLKTDSAVLGLPVLLGFLNAGSKIAQNWFKAFSRLLQGWFTAG